MSVQIQVEPVGRWFEAFLRRRSRNVSASFQELEEEEELSEEEEGEELQLEEYPLLKTLDPKDWKVCRGVSVYYEYQSDVEQMNLMHLLFFF